MILFLQSIMVDRFQPKIRIMTAGTAVTALRGLKGHGGMRNVMTPT